MTDWSPHGRRDMTVGQDRTAARDTTAGEPEQEVAR